MHIFQVALLLLGLAAVTLPATGKTVPESGKKQSYQLFNKQRVYRGRRAQDDASSGRVISQDLINRFMALKNPTSTTTSIISTITSEVPSGTTGPSTPTTSTITVSPATPTSPTATSPTTSPTSALTSPTGTTTTGTSPTTSPTIITNSTSRNLVGLINFEDEDIFESDDEDLPIVVRKHNRNSIYKYDDEEDVDDDAAVADNVDELGRAARARPSNWRRRQAKRRLQRQRQRQRRLNRRRRQAMRQRQRRQRLRRQQRRRNQQRRRRAGNKSIRRRNGKKGNKKRRRNNRRRIVRIKV